MDHTYCIAEKTTNVRRRDTYASRIERLKAANGKDVCVTETLMVEAGAWLKVVIKDEEEEEEVSSTDVSKEVMESCSIVTGEETERPDSLESNETCKRTTVNEQVTKCPDIPTSEAPSFVTTGEEDKAYLERAAARIRQFQMELKMARTFSVERFQDSARDMQFYTGLPNYVSFLTLYEFLRPKGSSQMQYWGSIFKGKQRTGGNELGRHRKLAPTDELFLTLIRLRRGLHRKDLAARFGISESVVTRVFVTWCNVMYERFQQLPVIWSGELEGEDDDRKPSQECGTMGNRQYVLKTIPAAVKEAYLQAAAYLTQSDLPVGSETRHTDGHTYAKPFIAFIEFLENYPTMENVQQNDTRDNGLTERQGEQNLSKAKTSIISTDRITDQL